ncbi:hypothetical protein HS088_TW04G01354 [Tripterygium wilfordii]|uniref:DUF4228 domain protein n=1 Tax=Tripterygium wilfordii TaxID=458696 RepID=A0A7J7DSP8_TRIWF|nr:hypothetical protein HS088_TW04G01354 [Tripterygium wilfordii]
MGCCFSCRTPSSSSSKFNNVRVVHLNGYVEEFELPISVGQVMNGQPPNKHFLCTAAQLISPVSKSLKPETQLEPGRIYFLMPYSTLQGDASPVDLAATARKLARMAKTSRCEPKSPTSSPTWSPCGSGSIGNSGARSINGIMKPEMACRGGGGRSWKPILDTIRERSFNRRSESEVLQEMYLEALK